MSENRNGAILVACYRRPYTRKSLARIGKLIEETEPSRVIVLSISETRRSSGTIESYLGSSDLRELRDELERDQRLRSSGYSKRIVEIARSLGVPVNQEVKEGEASEIILSSIDEHDPSHVVIHSSDKSVIDKALSVPVEDEVCKGSQCRVVVLD
jgi:hypothetical protein